MAGERTVIEQFRVVGSDGWESDADGFELLDTVGEASVLARECNKDTLGDGVVPGPVHTVQRREVGPWVDVPVGGEQA